MSAPAPATVPLSKPQPVLFLSHAGADTEAARKLAERIKETPEARAAGLKVWLDKNDLEPGHGWQEQLERVIEERSTAFAVYLGASGVVNWVESEVRLALSRARKEAGYRFIPIISAHSSSGALPGFARQYHGVRDIENDAAEFAKLIRAVLERAPDQPVQLVGRPFPGLVPFDESISHLFFGRERETEELVERLRRNPLLLVVGDSGSGKSSLVRAGLVPRFRGGALADRSGERPDESAWHVVATRPGGRPFQALADAVREAARVAGADADTRGKIDEWINTQRADRVRLALREGVPPKAKILLVVDQFEELLTLAEERSRQPYIDALLHLVDDANDTTVRVVLTMRRDYYNLCSQYPALYGRLENSGGSAKYPLQRMSEEGLRACVREPLKLAGVEESRLLEDEIVKDIGDQAGDLALVQMALSEAWRRRKEFKDDLLRAYISRGRVAGALANAADEVYKDKLSPDEQGLAEALFIRLVRLGDIGGTTRRIASRDEFSHVAWALAQKLATEDYRRLLVIRGEEGAETAELPHEALVTQWPRYQSWLQTSADFKRIHDRVVPAAKGWVASGRSRKALATGHQLDDAKKLLRERPTWFSEEERQFVGRSRRVERGSTWGVRFAAGALVALTALSVLLGNEADRQRLEAQAQQKIADEQREKAEAEASRAEEQARNAAFQRDQALRTQSRFLADLSRQQVEAGRPTVGVLLALEPLPRDLNNPADRPLVVQAETALYRAVVQHNERLIIQYASSAAFDAAGRRVVTASTDGTARLWDAETGAPLLTLEGHGGRVSSAAFDPAGRRVVTAAADGTARLWDAESGAPLLTLEGHDGWVSSAAFDAAGRRVVTAAYDGTGRLWDAESGAPLLTLGGYDGWVTSAAFDPAGRRVVTAADDNTARLWDAESGAPLLTLEGHDGSVSSAAFDPAGRRVVTASPDRTARLWDAESGAPLLTLEGHGGEVHSAAFDPAGRRVVTASDDNTARLWTVTHLKQNLIDHACELLPRVVTAEGKVELRRLTAEERKAFFLDGAENPDEGGRGDELTPVCPGR